MTFNVTPQLNSNNLTTVDLFCGGGIGGSGMKSAGYNILAAYDLDKSAVRAYQHNLGEYVQRVDVKALRIEDIPDTDVIFGGPPCQDFSFAGKGEGECGERGKLVWRYLEIIDAKKPKAFIFENVKGLIGKRHKKTFDGLIQQFERIGYTVSWQIINAWDYGVTQKRERVFVVGVRKDLDVTYEFPKPLAEDFQTRVLRDVLFDLPDTNNLGYGIRPDEKDFVSEIPQGKNWRALSVDKQKRFLGGGYKNGGGNSGYLRRASFEIPAWTLDTAPFSKSTCQLHPTENRRFTVRECLRIQSVPDWYVFTDDIPLSAQYRIVGNGVASRVAYLIGIALAEQLNAIGKRSFESEES